MLESISPFAYNNQQEIKGQYVLDPQRLYVGYPTISIKNGFFPQAYGYFFST